MVATQHRAFLKNACAVFLLTTLLVLVSTGFADAQICTGSLGDPIVNITFGAGTGNGPALDASTTNGVTYTTGCPTDGQYMIVNQSTSCYTDNWHVVTHDHTGDANGRFMLVNATVAPSDFFIKQIDGLCSGTTYQFSAWILNMVTNSGNDPNVTFRIEKTDGTLLGSANTGNITKTASVTWKQCVFGFSLPSGITSVVVRMRNNAPGGLGNDLALDDITFRPAGPAIPVGIQGVVGPTTTVCQSSTTPVNLYVTAGACFPNTSYQWQISKDFGTTWTDAGSGTNATYPYIPALGGTYMFRVLVADAGNTESVNCRVISNTLTVNVNSAATPTISIAAAPGTTVCPSTSVTFQANSSGVGSTPVYQWQINNTSVGTNSSSFVTNNIHDGDNVTCILTSSASCSAPLTSNAITMHVAGPITSGSITSIPSTTNICKGTPVTFAADAGGVTGVTYQWKVNGVNQGTNVGTFTPTTINDNDVIACVLSSSAGCSTPFTTNSITMHVANAIASVTISPNLNNVCEGTLITFTADQASASSYQWQVNGLNVGTNSPTYAANNFNDGDKVTCILISNSVCTTPVPSNTVQMQLIKPILSAVISASPTTICKGSPVTFGTIMSQKTGVTYQWLVNGQPLATATTDTFVTSSLNNNDAVTCTVTSTAGCNPPITPTPITITVEDLPQIILPTTAYQINQGESVNLVASATGNGVSYQWSPAMGLDKTNIANPTASPPTTTQYTLLVTTLAGCTLASAPVTVKVVIKEIKVPNSFTPNNDGVNDTWVIPGLENDATVKVQVYNRYGAPVYSSLGYNTPWNGSYKGKLLPAGVYYYAIHLASNTRKLTGFITIIR